MSEYDIIGKIMKNGILEGGEIWMFNHLLMVEEILGRKRGIVERLKERRLSLIHI